MEYQLLSFNINYYCTLGKKKKFEEKKNVDANNLFQNAENKHFNIWNEKYFTVF